MFRLVVVGHKNIIYSSSHHDNGEMLSTQSATCNITTGYRLHFMFSIRLKCIAYSFVFSSFICSIINKKKVFFDYCLLVNGLLSLFHFLFVHFAAFRIEINNKWTVGWQSRWNERRTIAFRLFVIHKRNVEINLERARENKEKPVHRSVVGIVRFMCIAFFKWTNKSQAPEWIRQNK